MADYTAVLSRKARKQLDKMQDDVAQPILDAIVALEQNPRPFGYKKLVERDGYRIRVGNYRVLYDIFDTMLIIEVFEVGNRKDVYD